MAGFYDQGYYTTFGDPAYPVGYDLTAAGSRPMIVADPYPYGAVLPAARAAPAMQRYTDLGYTVDPVYIGYVYDNQFQLDDRTPPMAFREFIWCTVWCNFTGQTHKTATSQYKRTFLQVEKMTSLNLS